jgi:hypothetical protein
VASGSRPHDVQALSEAETDVYEAVAALDVDERLAYVPEVAHMTGRPEPDVRRSLLILVETGCLLVRGDGFALGPHDWGVER